MAERNVRVVSSLAVLLKSTKPDCFNMKERLNIWQEQKVFITYSLVKCSLEGNIKKEKLMNLHKPGWKRQKLVEKIQLAKDFKDKNKSIML